MNRAIAALFVIYVWAAPAFAQNSTEGDFFKSVAGLSITAAVLLYTIYRVIKWLIDDRKELVTDLKKERDDTKALNLELKLLARDLKDAFEAYETNVKEGRAEVIRLHAETQGKLDNIIANRVR